MNSKFTSAKKLYIDPLFITIKGEATFYPENFFYYPIMVDTADPSHQICSQADWDKNIPNCALMAARELGSSSNPDQITMESFADFFFDWEKPVSKNPGREQLIQDLSKNLHDCEGNATVIEAAMRAGCKGVDAIKANLGNTLGKFLKDLNYAIQAIPAYDNPFKPAKFHAHRRAEAQIMQTMVDLVQQDEKALDQASKERAIWTQLISKLPENLKVALDVLDPALIVSSCLSHQYRYEGMAVVERNAILLDRGLIQNPQKAVIVLQEELLHLIDAHLKFSEREEWKKAADQEIGNLDAAKMEIINKSLSPHKQNPYISQTGYVLHESRRKELLVDYFHVKAFLAKEWLQEHHHPPAKTELNDKMQEIFPHIFPLCRQFEREILELGHGNSVAIL